MKKKKTLLTVILLVSVLYLPSVFADCVLGPKVTKDINGALNILRIVAPLILFGFTLYETIRALLKGDGAADFKNVFVRLRKRFIYVIILFFLPTLVSLGLSAMGLTDNCPLGATGTTVGEDSETNKPYVNTNKNQNDADNPKNSVCAAHSGSGKKAECENVSGCVFDATSNTCTADAPRNSNDAWNSACAAHNGAGKQGECEAAGCSFNTNNNTCNIK